MRFKLNILIFSSFISLIWLASSCLQNSVISDDFKLVSSLEMRSEDGKFFLDTNGNNILISGGLQQSKLEKRSGEYSLLTTPKSKYSLSVEFKGIKKDSYVIASIWRKGTQGHLVAVITGYKGYISTKESVITDSLGWEKLELEFHMPPINNYLDLKLYVWNSGKDTIFFDDYEINISNKKQMPEFNEDAFHVEIDTSDYLKIMNVRERAFRNGILQSEDDDWVKGFIFADNKMMKTNMRLKGDWLDHLHGNKWSFRVKLKKNNSWKNMIVFSIQNPMARLGINEWFLHKVLISEDVLTTRYGFIPITINGDNLGLYAYEEHFVKQLVESQNRREGPILRFLESALWDTRIYNDEGTRYNYKNPIFESATINPFSTGKTIGNPALYNQFLIAQELMFQYKNRLKPASEIFNTITMAKYFAMADVFLGRHSIIWHNQRFYYNPVLCKLEPISYDCYSDIGLTMNENHRIFGFIKGNSVETLSDEYLFTRELFNDTSFTNTYIDYLDKYSSVSYLDSVFSSYKSDVEYYDSLIKVEFPDQYFFKEEILENAEIIRNEIPAFKKQFTEMKRNNLVWQNISKKGVNYDTILEPHTAPNMVLCYKQETNEDSITFKVNSFFPEKIIILGMGSTRKRINQIIYPLPILTQSRNGIAQSQTFGMDIEPLNYVFFSIFGQDEIMTTEIMQWPEPTGNDTPIQSLIASYPFPDYNIIDYIEGDRIYIKTGDYQISRPVIIPAGYSIIFEKNTKIDFINNASFISYSPVIMIGDTNNPITITSSDFSCNGFTVLQADKLSKVENVIFSNLNTLNYEGWTLTGAVNFYESDVVIKSSTFFRNQCEDALNIIRSNFTVTKTHFDYIFSDAFDSDFSIGNVLNTTFTNIGNDAIDFSGSQILINNVVIDNASDKGISGGENSQLIVKNTNISNSGIGLASKDLSTVDVLDSKITNCNYGVVLLQKKPEYGPSTMILKNTIIQKSKTPYLIEIGSIVVENNDTIRGRENEVAKLFY